MAFWLISLILTIQIKYGIITSMCKEIKPNDIFIMEGFNSGAIADKELARIGAEAENTKHNTFEKHAKISYLLYLINANKGVSFEAYKKDRCDRAGRQAIMKLLAKVVMRNIRANYGEITNSVAERHGISKAYDLMEAQAKLVKKRLDPITVLSDLKDVQGHEAFK